jgi:2-polyprenyl-6-methoxyphenol hydroxylase-like FAD-dependent oxidoreductase
VGAGPVGMSLALELARHGVRSTLVDQKPHLEPIGSRSIVIARHTLESFEALGCLEPVRAKAVALRSARTYFRNTELFQKTLPIPEGELPAFVNLQQTHTERALLDRVQSCGLVDVQWGCELQSIEQSQNAICAHLRTSSGESRIECQYLVGCDGARSTTRQALGITFPGRSFADRFLIADIRCRLDFADERRFYFDPPFNPGRQVLIHPQPDSEWRIDWQVPGDTDAEQERSSRRLDERIRRLIGDVDYELTWLTSYRFHERCASRFRLGRAFLAGDSAHLMAPFGARGMNSGIEDARNLGWKLALCVRGEAGSQLLDTYEQERKGAALENIRVTSATMRFMTPHTTPRRIARDSVLRASLLLPAMRRFVNSGKLAEPALYGQKNSVVGAPVPSGCRQESRLAKGFTVMQTNNGTPLKRLLVRPDGYVAADLSDETTDPERLVASMLGQG